MIRIALEHLMSLRRILLRPMLASLAFSALGGAAAVFAGTQIRSSPKIREGIEHPFVDHRNVVGAIFFGAKGYMIFPDYSSYFTYLGPNRKPGPSASVPGNPFMDLEHFQNWIAAVRSRDASQLNAEIEQGYLSACLPHLANIAYATGRTLTFDPATETFKGDAEANALLTRKYREPYVVPTEV